MIVLREYQERMVRDILGATTNDLGHLPTGAGKTLVKAALANRIEGPVWIGAHRQELIAQISLALAKTEVQHAVFAPDSVVSACMQRQVDTLGRHWINSRAPKVVCSVKTLVSRHREGSIRASAFLVDEAHHILRENEWGRAILCFKGEPRIIGVTATPGRADGKGLGRHADGVFDRIIAGPSARDLITGGNLCKYRAFGPEASVDVSAVPVGASGDYVQKGLVLATRSSKIVGDAVEHYQKHAAGLQSLLFAVDVETAGDHARNFNAAGIPAATIHAATPVEQRDRILRDYAAGKFRVLCSVDIFEEGFDAPDTGAVLLCRATASLNKHLQQIGRGMRPAQGKPWLVILDLVGNLERHKFPDTPRTWTLNRRDRKEREAEALKIKIRKCPRCFYAWPWEDGRACPACQHIAPPKERRGPEFVDGDLREMDTGWVRDILVAAEAVVQHPGEAFFPPAGTVAGAGARAAWTRRRDAQVALREAMAAWAWCHRHLEGDRYPLFFQTFGVDALTCQTAALTAGAVEELTARIVSATAHVAPAVSTKYP